MSRTTALTSPSTTAAAPRRCGWSGRRSEGEKGRACIFKGGTYGSATMVHWVRRCGAYLHFGGGAGTSSSTGGDAHGGGSYLRQRALAPAPVCCCRGHCAQTHVGKPAESRPQNRWHASHAGRALGGFGWGSHLEVPPAQGDTLPRWLG